MDLVTLNKQKCNIYNSFFHYIFHSSVMLKFSWASFPIAEVPQCGVWPRFFSNSCSFMCAGFSSPRFSYCPLLSPKRRLYWMIIADFPYQIFFHPALVFLSEFLGGSQKLEFVLGLNVETTLVEIEIVPVPKAKWANISSGNYFFEIVCVFIPPRLSAVVNISK